LTFKLPPGGIVGIIGPNGAGKSTLFRMITGQEKPDAGDIAIGDSVQLGFVDAKADKAFGRPVGVAVDRFGALLVADDFGNVVWRVTPSGWRPSVQPQTAHAT